MNRWWLTDEFYAAHRLGYLAMDALGNGFLAEREHDKAETELKALPEQEYGRQAYLDLMSIMEVGSRTSFDAFAAAVVLFQAMMESLVAHFGPTANADYKKRQKDLSFSGRWELALGGKRPEFDDYLDEIYRKYRNPIAHVASSKKKFEQMRGICFEDLRSGFKAGWEAYDALMKLVNVTDGSDTWHDFCIRANVPFNP